MADTEQLAESVRDWAISVLDAAGHAGCDYLPQTSYDPDAQVVVCGCGVFEDVPEHVPAVGAAPVESGPGGQLDRVARDPIESTLALIDPTEHYTPTEIERHILDVLARLETGALFEREAARAHYAAKVAFERAYWRASEASEAKAADRRKAEAMLACETEHEALIQAEFVERAAKATMHNLRAILSGYQSTSRSIQSAYSAGGSPGRPS